MAKLGDEVKVHIVQALACFDTPSQVVESVKDEFDIVVTRQQVQTYDPEKAAGRKGMSRKLRAIFEATRRAFLEETAQVPIASQTYRLRNLQRLHQKAQQRGNMALAAALLEQAAKEVGGAFTNRREHGGPGGGPIPLGGKVEHEHLHKVADADLERFVASAITGAPGGGA